MRIRLLVDHPSPHMRKGSIHEVPDDADLTKRRVAIPGHPEHATHTFVVQTKDIEVLPEEPAMTLDPTKPLQTRDGRKARIICTDRKGEGTSADYPIIALVHTKTGDTEYTEYYTTEGKRFKHTPLNHDGALDLINVEHHTLTIDVYRNKNTGEVFTHHREKGFPVCGTVGDTSRSGLNELIHTTTIETTYPPATKP